MLVNKNVDKGIVTTIRTIFALLFILTIPSALADNTLHNQYITFEKPWVRALPPSVKTTAAYVEIHNAGDKNDELIAVSSSAIHMMSVHQTKESNGILSMVEADNTTIPAKGVFALQPGGYHMMLMGIKKPLTEDDIVTIRFEFKKAGVVEVDFPVRKK